MSGADTAAYAHGVPSDVDYREIPALMPLPGSTASGILTYNNTSASGTSATISVSPNDNAALIKALNDHEFQLMTSQEINDWINEVWITNLETYSGATIAAPRVYVHSNPRHVHRVIRRRSNRATKLFG